jgi:glutathione S-transferase
MKLYNSQVAPNCRRVRMFILEKGLELPTLEEAGDNAKARLSESYVKMWPHALVPMLETDDGVRIGEAMAICRFIEDEHPRPNLMGANSLEKAVIEMWERRAYDEGMIGSSEVFRNSHPLFANRGLPGTLEPVPQIAALIERGKGRVKRFYRKFEDQLKDKQFVAGDRFTVADITTLCSIDFAKSIGLEVPDDCRSVARWYREVSSRSAARASL